RFGRAGPIAHSGGLGLGLYLAREVIHAHGGSIRFDSKPNQGCTFSIDVPLQTRAKAAVSSAVGA
ncbi:MAG: ATP-binding protein, partial [Deltaproteobacteria bacterium]